MINLINIKITYPKLKLDIILRKLLNNSIILSRHTSIYLSFSLHNLNPFILKIFLPVIILLPNLSRNITRPSCRLWDFHVVSKLQDTRLSTPVRQHETVVASTNSCQWRPVVSSMILFSSFT